MIYYGLYHGRAAIERVRSKGADLAKTAKLFRNGRSQAVRLPAEFRFEGKVVFIRKDEKTGDVILSRRPESWQEFFRFRDAARKADPKAFAQLLKNRKDKKPDKRELFG